MQDDGDGRERNNGSSSLSGEEQWMDGVFQTRCKEEVSYNEGGEAWHRLPREVMDAPSHETSKARLGGLWAIRSS